MAQSTYNEDLAKIVGVFSAHLRSYSKALDEHVTKGEKRASFYEVLNMANIAMVIIGASLYAKNPSYASKMFVAVSGISLPFITLHSQQVSESSSIDKRACGRISGDFKSMSSKADLIKWTLTQPNKQVGDGEAQRLYNEYKQLRNQYNMQRDVLPLGAPRACDAEVSEDS